MRRSSATRGKRADGRPTGIAVIAVEGFKSLKERQSIDIRPLTLLAGANSSGKSSIMQPLLLLKQTLEAPYDPGALLLDGPNIRFTSTKQILSRSGRQQGKGFGLWLLMHESGHGLGFSFATKPGGGFDIKHMLLGTGQYPEAFVLFPEMTHEQVIGIIPPEWKSVHSSLEESPLGPGFNWTVVRDRCFLSLALTHPEMKTLKISLDQFIPPGMLPSRTLSPCIEGFIHLPGLRGNPERTYKTSAVAKNFPGTFENYVASVIHDWQENEPKKMDLLAKGLEKLELTWKVQAKQLDDTRVELLVGRLPHSRPGGARDLVSIADVGFGVSQTLPVLVALLVAQPGQIVYLEQPEIHLHPKAQCGLARVLAEAAERGVVTVVETHSALLLRKIQTLVAQGELDPGLVKLHWFTRRTQDGATQVYSGDLDSAGRFGDWPEDFDEVALEADRQYLDAVEARGIG
ncbi:MAG: AAA family ATPase [Armatimonadetes bacterium]|nr:AAA family ATPase [Armatimonadota bacterium]